MFNQAPTIRESIIIVLLTLTVFNFGMFMGGHSIVSNYLADRNKEFKYIPTDQVHTMRVYKDGSTVINYIDGTSEKYCLARGACQN